MNYQIASLDNRYRGMERTLLATHLCTQHTRKDYKYLLNRYYEYSEYLEQTPTEAGFDFVVDFYKELLKHEINCEIIVFDTNPIETAYGYGLDYLGVDIVCEMFESLLCECDHVSIEPFLNENGLCKSAEDVNRIVPLLEHGNLKWEPCYVYKVKI